MAAQAQAAESGETGEITGTAEARGITETKMAGTAETRENAELRITTGTEEARIMTAETRMETREPEESRTITAAAARECLSALRNRRAVLTVSNRSKKIPERGIIKRFLKRELIKSRVKRK